MRKSIHHPDYQRFLELLREMRLKVSLTQEQVAANLGEHQSFVSKYESGERRLDLIELEQVCKALGTTLTRFVSRYEKAGSK